MTARIDHLVIAAPTLSAAVAHGLAALRTLPGVEVREAATGSISRLWSLGEADYLAAMAPDPAASGPARAYWSGLGPGAAARLAGWALEVDDLDAALAETPEEIGAPLACAGGRIALAEDGRQPFDGLFPALVSRAGPSPATALEDHEARLVRLTLTHPEAGRLGWALSMLTEDDRLVVRRGPVGLSALIHTAQGEVTLE